MILYWATFIAILGCMRPVGHGLDTPGRLLTPTQKSVRNYSWPSVYVDVDFQLQIKNNLLPTPKVRVLMNLHSSNPSCLKGQL